MSSGGTAEKRFMRRPDAANERIDKDVEDGRQGMEASVNDIRTIGKGVQKLKTFVDVSYEWSQNRSTSTETPKLKYTFVDCQEVGCGLTYFTKTFSDVINGRPTRKCYSSYDC